MRTPTGGSQAGEGIRETRVVLPHTTDRKSVVEGRRVDLGGRRINKKKKKNKQREHTQTNTKKITKNKQHKQTLLNLITKTYALTEANT